MEPDELPRHLAAGSPLRYPCEVEYLCRLNVQIKAAPVVLGDTPHGLQIAFPFQGGELVGPRLTGSFMLIGGDWMTIRPDGIGNLRVRSVVETVEGAKIMMTDTGVFELGEDGYKNASIGKWPLKPPVCSAPTFSTGHPNYSWLNGLTCLGVGIVDMEKKLVIYDIYTVRTSIL